MTLLYLFPTMGFYLRFFLFIFIFLPTVCHTQVWLGNNLGEKDYLPQPWSPIQILEENDEIGEDFEAQL